MTDSTPIPTGNYHLAQFNVAARVAPLESPQMADFVARLDEINQLGDRSPGFVWRHTDDTGSSTDTRVYNDERIVINFSVWENIESLFEYTYHSAHVEVFRRRREWFEHTKDFYLVLWWIPAGTIPTVEEACERLDYLRANGPTAYAFTFKQRFEVAAMLAEQDAQRLTK